MLEFNPLAASGAFSTGRRFSFRGKGAGCAGSFGVRFSRLVTDRLPWVWTSGPADYAYGILTALREQARANAWPPVEF